MSSVRDLRRRLRQVTPQFLSACVMLYFLYHAVQGDRGLFAWLGLSQELEHARQVAETVGAERQALAGRVRRLQPDHLDADLLDERARELLNLARPDEIVVIVPKPVP